VSAFSGPCEENNEPSSSIKHFSSYATKYAEEGLCSKQLFRISVEKYVLKLLPSTHYALNFGYPQTSRSFNITFDCNGGIMVWYTALFCSFQWNMTVFIDLFSFRTFIPRYKKNYENCWDVSFLYWWTLISYVPNWNPMTWAEMTLHEQLHEEKLTLLDLLFLPLLSVIHSNIAEATTEF
jgi:hypothetical protein